MSPDQDETFRDDHDSPRKDVLEHYFPEFLSLLVPEIHAETLLRWSERTLTAPTIEEAIND